MSTTPPTPLTPAQEGELRTLQATFPYRIIYYAIAPDGEWFASAVTSRRIPNKLAREGHRVFIVR